LIPTIPTFLEEEVGEQPRAESVEDPAAGSIMRNDQPPPPLPPMPAPKPTTARRVRPQPEEDEEPPANWMTRGGN
jgi:hypothetical protein